jgi:hypothetical protein
MFQQDEKKCNYTKMSNNANPAKVEGGNRNVSTRNVLLVQSRPFSFPVFGARPDGAKQFVPVSSCGLFGHFFPSTFICA